MTIEPASCDQTSQFLLIPPTLMTFSPRDFLTGTIPLAALIKTALAVEAISTAISSPERPPPTIRTFFWTNCSWEGCRY